MYRVLVTGKISPAGLAILEARDDLQVDVKPHLPPSEILAVIGDYDAIVTRSETAVDDALLAAAPRLRLVARGGTGVDNIDIEAASRRGIFVCNTAGANTIAATEQTFALMLALCRNTFQAVETLKVQHRWHRTQFTGNELFGKTLGIVGLGRIGSQVAKRAQAFEMQVIAYDPYIPRGRAELLGVDLLDDLDTLLQRADIVTVHTPKTPETVDLIGARELALMKPSARIVNCARGGIINETALYEALKSGGLRGAALDVFDVEPAADHPLLSLDNVIATPHLGASTEESQEKVGVQLAEQVIGILTGQKFENVLNFPLSDATAFTRLKPLCEAAFRLGRLHRALGNDGAVFRFTHADLAPDAEPLAGRAFFAGLGGESTLFANRLLLPSTAPPEFASVGRERPVSAAGGAPTLSLTAESGGAGRVAKLTAEVRAAGVVLTGADDVSLESELKGHLVMVRNRDVPGMVGQIGTLLGQQGINLGDMHLGRSADAVLATAVFHTDQPTTAEVMSALASIDGVEWCTAAEFPSGLWGE